MTQGPSQLPASPGSVTTQGVARNTALHYVSTVFTLVNGLAVSIMVARSLGPDRLGIYTNVTFMLGLTVAIFSCGLGATLVKILSEYGARFTPSEVARVVRPMLLGSFGLAGLAAGVTWCALRVSNSDDRYSPTVLLLAFCATVPAYLAPISRNLVNGVQDFGLLLRLTVSAAIALLVCTALATLWMPQIEGFMAASMGPNLLIVGFVMVRYREYMFGRTTGTAQLREHLRDVFSYMWPLALINVLHMITWNYSEVLFLGIYRPPDETSFYTIAFGFSSLALSSVAQSVTAALVPALSQMYGAGEHERIRSAVYATLRLALVFTLPAMALIAVVSAPALLLMYGKAYSTAASYVPALVVSRGLGTISGVAADVMFATRQQRTMLKLSAWIAILNLALDQLLIPGIGVTGAVIANVAAQSIYSLVLLVTVFVHYKQSLSLRAYLRPGLATLLVLAATIPLERLVQGPVLIVAIAVVGGVSYLVGLRVFRVLTRDDHRLLCGIVEHIPHRTTRQALAELLRFCSPERGAH